MSEVKDITEYEELEPLTSLTPAAETALEPKVKEAVMIHESIIHHAVEAATHLYEMGRQLKTMRDSKLYKYLGYESFGEYVENNGEYSFKERQAYKYIKIVESYSSTFITENQGLGVERLEMLTALGERDAAELVGEADIEGMTTAEVKQLIRDKQGLGEQLSLLTDELEKTKSDSETTAAEKQQALDNANKEIADLKKKIKDQKKKHKDELNEKGSEILMLKEQLESGKLTDEKSEEIRKQVEDKLKAEYDERMKAAEDKMKSLEKKMHSADQSESRAALKVYFEETQKNLSTFLAKVNSLDDEAVKEKFLAGAVKWLEAVVAELKGI